MVIQQTDSETQEQNPGFDSDGPPPILPTTAAPAGRNPTIATYIQQSGIIETPVHVGDPGSPTINLPIPPGWQSAGADTPDWAYNAIVYTGADAAQYTPGVVVLMSHLTEDAQTILELAAGELNNLPGYRPLNIGVRRTLAGYPAHQLGGTWVQNGQTKIVAQKTVVIPAGTGVYVLQLNADALESQAGIVAAATAVIDAQTIITAEPTARSFATGNA